MRCPVRRDDEEWWEGRQGHAMGTVEIHNGRDGAWTSNCTRIAQIVDADSTSRRRSPTTEPLGESLRRAGAELQSFLLSERGRAPSPSRCSRTSESDRRRWSRRGSIRGRQPLSAAPVSRRPFVSDTEFQAYLSGVLEGYVTVRNVPQRLLRHGLGFSQRPRRSPSEAPTRFPSLCRYLVLGSALLITARSFSLERLPIPFRGSDGRGAEPAKIELHALWRE